MGLIAVVGAFYATINVGVQGLLGLVAPLGRSLLGFATPLANRAMILVAQVEFAPTGEGAPGGAMMQKLLNWTGQYGLWGCLASLIVGGGIWGLSQQFGNGMQAGKGKMLAAAGGIGAVIIGLAAVIVNTLFSAASG